MSLIQPKTTECVHASSDNKKLAKQSQHPPQPKDGADGSTSIGLILSSLNDSMFAPVLCTLLCILLRLAFAYDIVYVENMTSLVEK
ncbi:hypothetical protein EVAR_20990_1 [Eumeta japonica]|uniref:Uncharacterized protein n=1 Tax=Eumeta variegata TaxID=151549 RepID=A0A4C1V5K5_EUMVA|nr:hypothetical protein EVAR_20990_1 [Eumeta japonica]